MKTKYYAFFCSNASTYNRHGYEYSNIKEAEKEIREIAVGNTFDGNSFRWYITDIQGKTVTEGGGRVKNGKVTYYRF